MERLDLFDRYDGSRTAINIDGSSTARHREANFLFRRESQKVIGVFVIDVNNMNIFSGLKKLGLGRPIIFKTFMGLDVFLRQIGKNRRVKINKTVAVLFNAFGSNFQDGVLALSVNGLSEKLLN